MSKDTNIQQVACGSKRFNCFVPFLAIVCKQQHLAAHEVSAKMYVDLGRVKTYAIKDHAGRESASVNLPIFVGGV